MSTNDIITIYSQDDIDTILNQKSPLHNHNHLELMPTAFAQHTGLATADRMHAENTAPFAETWLCNKGELRDTVVVYQTDAKGRRSFADRRVDDLTVGVMPCLQNGDLKLFTTIPTPEGQRHVTVGRDLMRYPQGPVDALTAADLDRVLTSSCTAGYKEVGAYTAPDTGRQMPCYHWRGQYYVQHTNKEGHTAWFRCDPVAVVPLPNNKLGVRNVLFAAPFSNRQKFRERTQGVMADDALTLSHFSLGRFLQDTFLPELITSTTFGLSFPVDKIVFTNKKLSRLNITLRQPAPDHDLTR